MPPSLRLPDREAPLLRLTALSQRPLAPRLRPGSHLLRVDLRPERKRRDHGARGRALELRRGREAHGRVAGATRGRGREGVRGAAVRVEVDALPGDALRELRLVERDEDDDQHRVNRLRHQDPGQLELALHPCEGKMG